MKYELAIFDLDGTLLDTLDDLAAAVNHAMALHGFPPRSREEVRHLIGNGVASTIRRAVPPETTDARCARVLEDFKAYYLLNLSVHTRPFDGIVELLDALNAAGVRVAVNSNKVDGAVKSLCETHLGDRVALALGERAGIPKKPAPDGANDIIRHFGASPARTLYVGDGEADILTACNAGIDCAWVSWGYRRPGELGGLEIPARFDDPAALGRFILS